MKSTYFWIIFIKKYSTLLQGTPLIGFSATLMLLFTFVKNKITIIKIRIYIFCNSYIKYKMLPPSPDAMLKLSKTASPDHRYRLYMALPKSAFYIKKKLFDLHVIRPKLDFLKLAMTAYQEKCHTI